MQRDFMPGGVLGVKGADKIIAEINDLIPRFDCVLATQDWHAPGVSHDGWPLHCVQNTPGADFAKGLNTDRIQQVFRKDSYSAFTTGLEQYLRQHKLNDLYFVGVATDYCVFHTAIDALKHHFQVTIIEHACRGIDHAPEALNSLRSKGARIVFQ